MSDLQAAARGRAERMDRKRATASAQQVVDSHRDEDTGQLFGITELCREFDITLRTIRFYEDKELLKPRRINGTRVYTRRDRARLALILRSKAIGASLTEIKHYLDLYGAHGEGRVQQMKFVLDRTDQAIAELETRRAHIDATLAELRVINATVRKHLVEVAHPRGADGASPSRGRPQRPGKAGSAAAAGSAFPKLETS